MNFKLDTYNHIVQELAYLNNQIIGDKKTAFTALGLFLKLPIVIDVHQHPNTASDKKLQLDDLLKVVSCYTDTETQEMHFVFFYNNEKQLKHINKIVKKQTLYFAYLYLKEVQHILRKHYTAAFQSTLLKKYKQRDNPHFHVKLVCDIVANSIMHSIFKQSRLADGWNKITPYIDYRDEIPTEIELIKEFKATSYKCKPVTNSDRFVEYEINGFTYILPKQLLQGSTEHDIQTQNLANAIINVIRTNSKGTHGADAMIESFESIKTDAAWFDKLKGTIINTIYNKTNKHDRSWKNLKRTYRHIFKAPADVHADNKVNIIVSIDQSGSIEIADMQKLLGIFESQSHKIAELTVIIHDVDVAYTTNIKSDFDISESPKFREALSKRYASGGTSHKPTFEYIQDMNINSPKDYIYICMSDMYSDIENEWAKYPILRKLTTFWLSPQNTREIDTKQFGGTNIKLP